jgi:hypothetical protein
MLMEVNDLSKLDGDKKNDGDKEALAIVEDLLLSPVLRDVLCKQTNLSFREGRSSIVARIDRAELGEYDARILGSFLISQFKGQIIVPDFRILRAGFPHVPHSGKPAHRGRVHAFKIGPETPTDVPFDGERSCAGSMPNDFKDFGEQ